MSGYTIPYVTTRTPQGERTVDVYSRLLAERVIYLGTAIDDGVANVIIAQLIHLESESADQSIHLYINSSGGSVPATLAIYDAMQYIRPEVATTCVGEAAASISDEGSLRPRSISDRYCADMPARFAISARRSPRSARWACNCSPATVRHKGSGPPRFLAAFGCDDENAITSPMPATIGATARNQKAVRSRLNPLSRTRSSSNRKPGAMRGLSGAEDLATLVSDAADRSGDGWDGFARCACCARGAGGTW